MGNLESSILEAWLIPGTKSQEILAGVSLSLTFFFLISLVPAQILNGWSTKNVSLLLRVSTEKCVECCYCAKGMKCSWMDKSYPFQQIEQYGSAVKVFGHQWVTQGRCYKALRGHFDCLSQLTKSALLPPRLSICSSLSPHRSLCPHSPSRPPKPDYCLSIQTQSLLLIRTNLLVIEHTSSLLRPAKTGADLPQTIINLKCLPFLSFPNPCHPSAVAAQLLSRSIELLNGHNQPSGTTRQWILKIHQAANQQASTWQTLLFSYGVTVTLGPPLTLPCYKESESAPLLRLRTNNLLGTFDLVVQHSVTAMWRQPCWERESACVR